MTYSNLGHQRRTLAKALNVTLQIQSRLATSTDRIPQLQKLILDVQIPRNPIERIRDAGMQQTTILQSHIGLQVEFATMLLPRKTCLEPT